MMRPHSTSMADKLELSIVVTSRNDDHGRNLLERMQLFVNGLLAQCEQYQLPAELVLVEWNPPAHKPKLSDALKWPVKLGTCEVRIIEVSPEIHKRFKCSEHLPLFQMIAKNVGIRRARGRFVLATNIDLLFSDELIQYIAFKRLRTRRMYRVDRHDIPSDIPADVPLADQLAYCRQHVLRIWARDGIHNLHSGHYLQCYPKLTWSRWIREKLQDWRVISVTNQSRLHIKACGDFTRKDRESWFALRGYPEFEMYSFNIDSVLCYAAHHSGVRELVLHNPRVIYHIEHALGSGWSPEGHQALKKRLDAAGIPQVSGEQLSLWAIQMRREHKPLMFNEKNWGLADHELPEIMVS